MSTDLPSAAARYAAHGWHIFPCQPRAKEPATGRGFHDATRDPATIERWWTETPDANIGLHPGPSGFVVIDVDGPEGRAAAVSLGLFSEPTRAVLTGRPGGVHLYYRHPGFLVSNRPLAPHLDVRADDGYTLVPPSVHPTGAVYRWDKAPVLGLPPDVVALLQNGHAPRPAAPLAPGVPIPEGQRNQTLASLAGTMRRRGMEAEEIAAGLLVVNATRCRPPLPDDEVQGIAVSVARYPPALQLHGDHVDGDGHAGPGLEEIVARDDAPPSDSDAGTGDDSITLTDTGNATRFIRLDGDRLHYLPTWGRWLVWTPDAGRWVLDHRDVQVRQLAKAVGHQLKQDAATMADGDAAKRTFAWALKSLNAHGISGLVDLARGIEGIALDHELLDRDAWVLAVPNGVIELRTGQLRPADPADLITMQCPILYAADAIAPRWEQAVTEWFPNPEVRAYVQRVAGAALVGEQRDHVFVIHYGDGGNGKGTFTRTLQRVLGPYAVEIHLSLLVETTYREHDTVRADLFRRRLALAVETERRIRLAEASVKNLTGGDRIRARRMREDPWSFDPSHSLWLQTNYLPEITGRDAGIWRRIRVVKWVSRFEGPSDDQHLGDTLADEAPGILRWLVEGCLAWQRSGLAEPDAVVRETLAYRAREDVFARFAADTGLAFRPGLEIPAAELQRRLTAWAEAAGIDPPRKEIGDWLREHGARRTQRRTAGPDGRQERPHLWIHVGLDDGDHTAEQTDALS